MAIDADAERRDLLEQLAEARRKAAQLPTLTSLLPATFFDDIECRIEIEVDGLHSVKLPVAFFLLVRRDIEALGRLDAILARLAEEGQQEGLANLVERLVDRRNHRRAGGALFEVDILTDLLRDAQFGGILYPGLPGTARKAEASIQVGGRQIYMEATVLTQSEDQERLQDLAITSAYRSLTSEEQQEAKELGATVEGGIVSGTGRPYNDAYRVIVKLHDKRDQLAAGAPNVICLGIADHVPRDPVIRWAVDALFTGSSTVLDILIGQIQRAMVEDGLGHGDLVKAQEFLKRVQKVRGHVAAEPRITAIAVYRWTGHRFDAERIYRNPQPGPDQRLNEEQWGAFTAALGFPLP